MICHIAFSGFQHERTNFEACTAFRSRTRVKLGRLGSALVHLNHISTIPQTAVH